MTGPNSPSAHDPVLVVDDNELNRDLLSRRLTQAGYQVALAASGEEALEYLRTQPASIVLLDVNLGGLSGLDVLRIIRQSWTAARLPIIMVTAQTGSGDIVGALDLGADDYVTKPIDYPVALARIRTQLARKDAEDRLRASEQRYALAARGANDGLWDWDLLTDRIYYSDRWTSIVGEEAGVEPLPGAWFSRVHPDDLAGVRQKLADHLEGRSAHFESEHRIRHQSGSLRWVRARGLAVRDDRGTPLRIAGSLSDITSAKVADPLTGLPNQVLFLDRLEQQWPAAGASCAVLFLDLDGFKLVNDSLGQSVGDDLLRAVADRLHDALDDAAPGGVAPPRVAEPTVARLGSDEFVIMLPDAGNLEAVRAANRLQQALAPAFTLGPHSVFVTASIGIATGGGDNRPQDVLRDAGTAMARAKAQGKGRVELFDQTMRDQVIGKLRLETALRVALDAHQFVPFYQPIVDLATGRLAAFEALIRWRHPERGIVMPGEFVAATENNGLIVEIGRHLFADVCRQMRAWRVARPEAPKIAVGVNFAAPQFDDPGLADRLVEILDETGVDPSQIIVEVTESTAVSDMSRAVAVLTQIRDAGMRVVLDDFGTGYSSLACLQSLPITGLKLDRSFIAGRHEHPEIVRSVVSLARHLQLTVTAEGVETVQQCEHLRALGCHFAQGFLFGKALEPAVAGDLAGQSRSWLAGIQDREVGQY